MRDEPPKDSTAAVEHDTDEVEHDAEEERQRGDAEAEERTGLLDSAEDADGDGAGGKDSGSVYSRKGGDSTGGEAEPAGEAPASDGRPIDLSFADAVKLPVFWTTASGMLCAMWTYPAVLEQLQPALLAEGLAPAEAVSCLQIRRLLCQSLC